uniref:VWFD domain-containing protein n=1 Tax=Panagrolaimus sp. ES5 TaxID=591445 RepID=A0AC34GE78_9BILA
EDCDKYMKSRHPDDGSNYTAPTTSLGNGDPHYTTFDGLYYTFNGAGEFCLIKNSTSQPFAAQARHIIPTDGEDYALLLAYAFQPYPNASIIQVEISTEVYHDRVPIPKDILQNTYTTIDASIYMPSDDTIVVTFNAGFSFNLQFFDNSWSAVTCFIDNRHKGNYTRGLLGSFDGNSLNDLETPEGVIVPANSTTEVIHYKFGLEWYVTEDDSLFDYFSKNYSDYYFPNFVPRFDYGSGQLPPDAVAICGNDASCLWDLVTTGDVSVANQTR